MSLVKDNATADNGDLS